MKEIVAKLGRQSNKTYEYPDQLDRFEQRGTEDSSR